MSFTVEEVLSRAPILPVIAIENVEHAVPLAQALVAGGLPVLEVTLRTDCALEAIRRIKAEVTGAIVGAGTVLTPADLQAALEAGSEFIVTPGATPDLLAAGVNCGVPFLPAVATVSEMMRAMEFGIDIFKFFPAEALGGVKTLKAYAGPFARARFCPTGGISPDNMADYLALPAVLSVGGSWVCPADLVARGEWRQIEQLAANAVAAVGALKP